MDFMFWVWLGVIVVTAIAEFATMEIVSIWFTFGAIIPFIMAATNSVSWVAQIIVFVVISALLIVSLRSVTKKFLFKGAGEKTNLEMYIGMQYRMISRTDFETVGSIKVNDVIWSAVGLNRETIEEGAVVQIIDIDGNKFIVREIGQIDKNEEEIDFDEELVVEEKPQENEVVETEAIIEDKSAETKSVAKKSATSKKSTGATTKSKSTSEKSAVKPATKKVATAKAETKTAGAKKPANKSVLTKSTKTTSTKQTTKKTVKKGENK